MHTPPKVVERMNAILDVGEGRTMEEIRRAYFDMQPGPGSDVQERLARIEAKLDALVGHKKADSPVILPSGGNMLTKNEHGVAADAAFVSIKQASTITQLSQSHLRRAVWSKELPAANAGSPLHPIWRIARTDLAAWLKAKMGGSNVPPKSKIAGLVNRYFPDT